METLMKGQFSRDEWIAIYNTLNYLPDDVLNEIETVFNARTQKYYNPARVIVLDELSYAYKGRSRHRTYNPKKPNKWHLKFYGFVDSEGFCYRLKFCRGKLKTDRTPRPKDVLGTLMRDFAGSLPRTAGSYIVICDNYYASLDIVRNVLAMGHDVVATVRPGRPAFLFKDFLWRVLGKVQAKKKENEDAEEESEEEWEEEDEEDENNPTSGRKLRKKAFQTTEDLLAWLKEQAVRIPKEQITEFVLDHEQEHPQERDTLDDNKEKDNENNDKTKKRK
jgi:hypothetical protein